MMPTGICIAKSTTSAGFSKIYWDLLHLNQSDEWLHTRSLGDKYAHIPALLWHSLPGLGLLHNRMQRSTRISLKQLQRQTRWSI